MKHGYYWIQENEGDPWEVVYFGSHPMYRRNDPEAPVGWFAMADEMYSDEECRAKNPPFAISERIQEPSE